MGDDKDEKPEYEPEGTPPYAAILATIERMASRFSQGGAIAFIVTREEFKAHLEERAAFYRSEVEELRSGNVTKIGERMTAMQKYQRQPGMPPIDEKKAADAIRQWEIEQARAKATMYDFAAKHLAENPTFTIDLSTAMHYEMVPRIESDRYGMIAGGVPQTLMPFA